MDRSKTRARLAAAFVLLAMLAGCAGPTPYGAKGLMGGYTDTKVNDVVYRVAFDGNGHTSDEMVVKYWLYRCAELTVQNGYEYFGLLPENAVKSSALPEPTDDAWQLPAERDSARASRRMTVWRPGEDPRMMQVKGGGGYHAPIYIYTPGQTIRTWHKKGVIEMYHSRIGISEEQQFALRASTVVEMLKPYVKSEGKEAGPSRHEVIEAALKD